MVCLLQFLVVHALFTFTMTDTQIEQRTVIKFLVKSGKSLMDCWRQLQGVFGDQTISAKTVRVWAKKFSNGHEDVKDKKRPGRTRSACTAENIQKVQDAILQDRRATLSDLSEMTDVKRSSLHTIVK